MKDSFIKRRLINIYEKLYEKYKRIELRTVYRMRIMRPERTIRYIKKNHCSIARYGNGEFDHILSLADESYQMRTPELAQALRRVLAIKNKKLLLCIPRCMNTVKECNKNAANFWLEYGKRDNTHRTIVKIIREYSGCFYLFGDAQITRPYIDWKTSKRADKTFPMLKKIWEGQDVIIVEGEQTRLGVGNDLFREAKSIKRILAPAINAFDVYNEIMDTIKGNYSGELIIIALGPTATVLAADLSQLGIWALDIGHIDIEYEWYLRGVKTKTAIEGKYTNEVADGRVVGECQNKEYLSQIIARVNH